MCGENGSKCKEYLTIVTLADRISTKRTTCNSLFEIQFGQQAILPIDIKTNTYLAIEWNKLSITEELLEARTIQIVAKEETRLAAAGKLRDSRQKSVQYLDKKMAHRLRNPLELGDLVLVYNKLLESQWGLLFKNHWNGPYRVINQINNGPYELEALDGTKLTIKFAASHIKRFVPVERKFNQVQSQKMKAVNKFKMKSQYWRENKLNKMNMSDIGKVLNCNGGDSIKWGGGCSIPYHEYQFQAYQ
ncbi:hypothetical protein O181_090006 [Austropuccinia psidii MF-1]|uniref:Uncharacterized protein n=1 Tax=Austropuccinia psidii MF-1 TaxID=1389203 RepID=A0A9Q3IUQ2_9BASI|nr:hypothetical protein [Austropuccinia psidii MF-1]